MVLVKVHIGTLLLLLNYGWSYSVDLGHVSSITDIVSRPPLSNSSSSEEMRQEILLLRNVIKDVSKAIVKPQDSIEEASLVIACGDCYGAQESASDCCNSCSDVEQKYNRRGWNFDPSVVGQCTGGGTSTAVCGDLGEQEKVQKKVSCSSFLGCDTCVAGGCAWCISQRACRPDEAWQCQGDVDHIGLSGIGKHVMCPTAEQLHAVRQERQVRVETEETRRKMESASVEDLTRDVELADDALNEAAAMMKGMDEEAVAGFLGHYSELENNAKLLRSKLELLVHELSLKREGGIETSMSRDDRLWELKRRAELVDAKNRPYEVLGVDSTSSQGEIRSAYRKLSLLLHPDKAVGLGSQAAEWADAAFADLVASYEMLGTPDKRQQFDDYGSHADAAGAFNTEWEFEKFGNDKAGGTMFYSGHPLITTLTERLWERRVGRGDTVWIVEFYAPWCSHCQRAVDLYKEVAEKVDKEGTEVEFAAINCVQEGTICNEWFGIRAYPTFLAINDFHGTRQEFNGNKDDADAIVDWASKVKREWSWLFRRSSLVQIESPNSFMRLMSEAPKQLFLVLFLDGVDCQPCKTAKTNLLRLAASLHYSNVTVAFADCEQEPLNEWCYGSGKCLESESGLDCEGLPPPPHAPFLKALTSHRPSETLYNSNELESHLALQLIEKVLRHALDIQDEEGGRDKYKKEEQGEGDDEHAPPDFMWNGPAPREPVSWGGDSGMGGGRHAIGN